MSKQFDEALALARIEAQRLQQNVVIVQDDAGGYALDAESACIDSPCVVHIVEYVRSEWLFQTVGESVAMGRDGIDDMIDELRSIFGVMRPTGTVH